MKTLVCGSGGFIGGWLTRALVEQGHQVRGVDVKPLSRWYQQISDAENLCLDLHNFNDCRRACEGADTVIQLAANMGGMGYIERNRIECMYNIDITRNMLEAAYRAGVKKFFFSSSACVYNTELQQTTTPAPLKESDAYPAMAERGYGWEKLFAEMLCQEYTAELGMKTYIARFHNVYGPNGDWNTVRAKAPAAICRKVIECKHEGKDTIDIWGDGTQERSYMWIDDCVLGIQKIIACDALIATPINLGSSEMVSVNQLVDLAESFAGVKLKRNYQLDAPRGVVGRNSDNTMIKSVLGWEPHTALREGLRETYNWIESQYLAMKAGERVVE